MMLACQNLQSEDREKKLDTTVTEKLTNKVIYICIPKQRQEIVKNWQFIGVHCFLQTDPCRGLCTCTSSQVSPLKGIKSPSEANQWIQCSWKEETLRWN